MDKDVWSLLTSMFLLLTAAVLCMFAFLFQGSAGLLGICFYGALFCALIGLAKGVIVILDHHKHQE